MRPGILVIYHEGGEQLPVVVNGGFAEVGPAGLTVLAKWRCRATSSTSRCSPARSGHREDVADEKDDWKRDSSPTSSRSSGAAGGAGELGEPAPSFACARAPFRKSARFRDHARGCDEAAMSRVALRARRRGAPFALARGKMKQGHLGRAQS
jgi:hypothetical protein